MGKGLSITAFILSFIFPVIGLILGIIAYNKAKEDPEALKGLAIAAIVIGAVLTFFALLLLVFVGVAWVQIRGDLESGSDQANLVVQCLQTDIRISSADAASDTITISKRSGDSTSNTIKVFVNSREATEVEISPFNIGDSKDINVQINSGDFVEVSPVIGNLVCSQRYELYVN